jgi:eukaryotic-like serine/threonine-protein kinase
VVAAVHTEEIQSALPDRYRVLREIGRGGMAVVYLAEDVPHEREVAVKVLSPQLGTAIDGERFRREIRIAAQLSHPNILPAYDSGGANGVLFYVMPFVQGESLRKRLDRVSQLTIEDAIAITCEVADALEYAHGMGVVHRDIKPENILLQSGHAVVADFGIASVFEDNGSSRLTGTGMSIGTATYMSPEQFSGQKVDGRSDMYSLACVLYEMLVGAVPFDGPNAMAIMARHTMQEVPSIRMVRNAVPEELEAIIMQAMQKVPADRFASLGEFKEALLGGEHTATFIRSTRAYTAAYRSTHNRRRVTPSRIALGGAIAAVLLTAGILGARAVWPGGRSALAGDANANRVGVLYFADDSKNGQLRYLADGLTESLIDQLSQVSALDVVSADGVRPFRGASVPLDSISRALKVGTLVRGVVEPGDKGVKVTVRLTDPLSNTDIAKKSIDLDTTDVANLQRQVAVEVSEFLRSQLGNQVRLRDQRKSTTNGEAWMLVQRAEKQRKDADSLIAAHADAQAQLAFAQADSFLSRAERVDKGGFEAPTVRSALALAHAQSIKRDQALLASVVDSGLAFADRALATEPRDADALQHKGELLFLQYQQHLIADPGRAERVLAQAESTLTKAVSIEKNQAGAWAALSAIYARNSELQKANVAAFNAYKADAYLSSAKTILTRLFSTSYNLESFPEAMQWCDEGSRRFPREPYFVQCRLMMYLSKYKQPDIDSAWAYSRQYAALYPDSARVVPRKKAEVFVAGTLVRAGLADSARRVLLRTRATPAEDPRHDVQGYEVVVRVMLGEQDEAIRLIEDYLTVNPEHRKGFAARTVWWWRDLQGNQKFQRMIAGAH